MWQHHNYLDVDSGIEVGEEDPYACLGYYR
jgi:hypothetical protein